MSLAGPSEAEIKTLVDILKDAVCTKCGRRFPDMDVGPWEVGNNHNTGKLDRKEMFHIHHNHGARDCYRAIHSGHREVVKITEKQAQILSAAIRVCLGSLNEPMATVEIYRESGMGQHAFNSVICSLYTKGLLFRMPNLIGGSSWAKLTKAGKETGKGFTG